MIDNTIESINFLKETIKELYSIELIFQDLKNNEININWEDEKFIIPYNNKRKYLLDILSCAYTEEKILNRIYKLIINEAKKTLKDNSQNIDKLFKYSIELALKEGN